MEMAPIRGLIMWLADKYPNAKYSNGSGVCSNLFGIVTNGPASNGCIVGQSARISAHPVLMSRIYRTKKDWAWQEDGSKKHYLDYPNSCLNAGNLLHGVVDPKDIEFALQVQQLQDNGNRWKDCVTIALARGY